MILACPECQTKYLVNDGTLGPEGRRVRCVKCRHVWHQKPPEEPIETDEKQEVSEKDLKIQSQEEVLQRKREYHAARAKGQETLPAIPKKKKSRNGAIAWIILICVLVGVGSAAVLAKQQIIQAVPQLTPLYQLLHLAEKSVEAETLTLNIEELKSKRVTRISEQGLEVPYVEISGYIKNYGTESLEIPSLLAQLVQNRKEQPKKIIKEWYFKANSVVISAGEIVTFKTSYDGNFADVNEVNVEFWTDPLPEGVLFLE